MKENEARYAAKFPNSINDQSYALGNRADQRTKYTWALLILKFNHRMDV